MAMAAMQQAVDWLLAPLSGAADHGLEPWAYWHARLMVLSWSLLLPLGSLVARFFKVTRRQDWPRVLDNQLWFRAHLWGQSLGVAVMTLGVALALANAGGTTPAASAHHWFGWIVAALGWAQIAAALARGVKGGPTYVTMRGDHYDMTPRRIAFEYVHKSLGWIALLLAIPATGLGLWIADAPRWMPLTLALWWALLIAGFVVLQRQGRCFDTYQAIWGPDPVHPGNRRKPIGSGVRRVEADRGG